MNAHAAWAEAVAVAMSRCVLPQRIPPDTPPPPAVTTREPYFLDFTWAGPDGEVRWTAAPGNPGHLWDESAPVGFPRLYWHIHEHRPGQPARLLATLELNTRRGEALLGGFQALSGESVPPNLYAIREPPRAPARGGDQDPPAEPGPPDEPPASYSVPIPRVTQSASPENAPPEELVVRRTGVRLRAALAAVLRSEAESVDDPDPGRWLVQEDADAGGGSRTFRVVRGDGPPLATVSWEVGAGGSAAARPPLPLVFPLAPPPVPVGGAAGRRALDVDVDRPDAVQSPPPS